MLLVKSVVAAGVVCAGLLLAIGCGEVPTGVTTVPEGALEVQVKMVNSLKKAKATAAIQVDSLVMKVYGENMDTIRFARSLALQQPYLLDTVRGIPAGSRRMVEVFTVNKAGEVIQEDSAGVRIVAIDPSVVVLLPVVLIPKKGSIYLQLTDIPTTVDSIKSVFKAENGVLYRGSVARSPKVFLSIDGIPHNTKGTLTVAGIALSGDTLYKAEKEVVVDAQSSSSLDLRFNETPGGLSISTTVVMPGVTIASGSMGTNQNVAEENGELIITEIMYAANDSEYIEMYNPGSAARSYDTLIIEVDGKDRLFEDVVIAARSYYVIGRILLPWTDAAHSVKSALDLSTTGNWVALKNSDGKVLDLVAFTGGSNTVEWPKVTGKQAIVLDEVAYNAHQNNFGRNWKVATTPISGTTTQMGTPHSL